MAIYAAVLDASVLVPISLADTLLRAAEKQMFRPVWSQRILDETRFAIATVHPDIPTDVIERRIWHMNETFDGALIENFEAIEAGLTLPDPNDNHVLAAACAVTARPSSRPTFKISQPTTSNRWMSRPSRQTTSY